AWSAQSILSRSFYALKDSVTPVVIGTLVTLVFIPMNGLFMRDLGMGVKGLALATTIAASLHAVVMTVVLRRRLGGFEMGRMAVSVGKTMLASLIAGGACWAVRNMFGEVATGGTAHVKLHAAITLALGFGIGSVVYVGSAAALRMTEMQQAISMLRRRKKS